MKRWRILLLTLACLLTVAGCQAQPLPQEAGPGLNTPGQSDSPPEQTGGSDASPEKLANTAGDPDASNPDASGAEPTAEAVPDAVMVDGRLYYATGRQSELTGRCGVMDGEITAQVDADRLPTEDGQSNFCTGVSYQYMGENTIELALEEGWMVFEAASEDEDCVYFHGKQYSKAALSEDTLTWLQWYNGLSQEDQLKIDAVPAELVETDGPVTTQDVPAP